MRRAGPNGLRLHNPIPNRPAHEIGKGGELEFAHHRSAVGLHGLDAERETPGDVLVAPAFRKKLHDLALARGQALGRARHRAPLPRLEEAIEHDLRDAAREIGLVPGDALDGWDELPARAGLQKIAARACRERLADQLLALMHREDQDLGLWHRLADASGRLEPIQLRHGEIEHRNLWPRLDRKLDRLAPNGKRLLPS